MKRLSRKDPVRIGPRRNFAGMYGVQPSPASNSKAPENSCNGSEPRTSAPISDAPPSIVDTAYRVIEKYIEEGRAAAQQFSRHPYTSSWMTGDGAQQLLEILLRVQSEFVPLWFDAVSGVMRTNAAPSSAAPFQTSSGTSNGSRAVTLEISSLRPTEVSVDLRDLSEGADPVCLGARALGGGVAEITDICIVSSRPASAPRVRIRVNPEQPPGQYSGVIVDRKSGSICGTIGIAIAHQ